MTHDEMIIATRIIEAFMRKPHLMHGKGEMHFIRRVGNNGKSPNPQPLNIHTQKRLATIAFRLRGDFDKASLALTLLYCAERGISNQAEA